MRDQSDRANRSRPVKNWEQMRPLIKLAIRHTLHTAWSFAIPILALAILCLRALLPNPPGLNKIIGEAASIFVGFVGIVLGLCVGL